MGCPIRRSRDHRALAPPPSFSQRATSFIASRCQGIHQMPFSCCARAQPQARASRVLGRGQMPELRGQTRKAGTPEPLADLQSLISDLWERRHRPAAARAAASRIPMLQARPRPEGRWPDLLHGHDSLHDFREQRTENRGQTRRSIAPILRRNSRFPTPEDLPKRHLFSVLCPLASEPGGPGPTRTADLTLIRRAL